MQPAKSRGFRLQIEPGPTGSYGLSLVETNGSPETLRRVVVMNARAARSLDNSVHAALRDSEVTLACLGSGRKESIELKEEPGVRLALILFARGFIEKNCRIEAIKQGVSAMSDEEVYYWYAKCADSQSGRARRARRALRLLLAAE